MVFATVARDDFAFTRGEDKVKSLALTSFALRTFCRECGSPLTVSYDFQPETIDFTVCTLDDPGSAPPRHHIFWTSGPAWLDIADDLPRYPRFRPGTRGLDGTEPPA